MPWDPDRYHQFQQQRSAPFYDLLALVEVRPALKIVDLGCGSGELTRQLADALPESEALGLDTSPQMLEKAAAHARPRLRFEQMSIEEAVQKIDLQGSFDLVFSNAAIQWVEDHETLVPRLLGLLRPGGQLAVQLPSNHTHPTHTLIVETAGEEPFRSVLEGWTRRPPVLALERYAELLYQNGGQDLLVFEKIYPHVLENADALADWTSGTALVPYFERLGEAQRETFMQRYRQRLWERYPESPVFYGFRRILFTAKMFASENHM